MDSNSFKKSNNSLVGSVTIRRKESIVDFEVFWKDRLVADVTVDYVNQKVIVSQYTSNPIMKPFPKKTEKYTLSDVLDFLESRCFPKERVNSKELLELLGLSYYNPLEIVKKTHGVQFDDFMWVRFKGEELTYGDVKIRD